MDVTASHNLTVLDWIIDNVGCWNGEIQNTPLTTQGFDVFDGAMLELYPRGPGGQDDHLVVRLVGFEEEPSGNVSFIGPDGSLICSQEIIGRYVEDDVLELPPGPRFEDVVDRIRRRNDDMDRLTVRFRFEIEDDEEDCLKGVLFSALDVFETSLKISFTSNDVASFDGDYSVEYPSKGGVKDCMLVEISEDLFENRSEVIGFKVTPNPFREKMAVRTFVLLKNLDGSVLRTEENEHIFDGNKESWMFSNSLTRDEVTEGVSVFINFKITYSNSFKHLSMRTKIAGITPTKISRPRGVKTTEDLGEMTSDEADCNLRELSKELASLYHDEDFSDVQLICEDVYFPVHKAILSVRSPVFKTMLSTDMKEAESSKVVIEDLDAPTVDRFLSFLYTGAIGDLQFDNAFKLYYAADKYQVHSLKGECAFFFWNEMSVSNVCDILSLANEHEDDDLTGVARDFILENYNEVLGSDAWEGFMVSEPLLAVDILTQFGRNNAVGKTKYPFEISLLRHSRLPQNYKLIKKSFPIVPSAFTTSYSYVCSIIDKLDYHTFICFILDLFIPRKAMLRWIKRN